MSAIGDFLVNATALSGLYALLAIGFTLIFGVGRVLNFAHAAFITIGAFAAYQVSNPNQFGLPVVAGLVAAFVITGIVGAIVYKVAISRVEPQGAVGMILTIVIAFFLMFTIRAIYGTRGISVPSPAPGIGTFFGLTIQYHLAATFVLAWASMLSLLWLMDRTATGKAIVATSMDVKGARLAGVDTDTINLYVWIIAAGLAGIAGMLLAGFQGGGWFMGIKPLTISFAIVVLGGLGSIKGSIVGAHVIGFIETGLVTFVNPALGGAAGFVILIGVLLFRPSGLWGHEIMEES